MASTTRRSPLVSVILTTYNRLAFLETAYESARLQTLRDREIIVVDGGSDDGTSAWLRRPRRAGTRVLELPGNPGPAALMNAGLRAARGRLIAFLESDDYWLPSYLEELSPRFTERGVDLVYCGCFLVGSRGAIRNVIRPSGRAVRKLSAAGVPETDPVFTRLTGQWRPMLLSMTMFRRSAFRRLGAFDGSFRWLGSDMDFFYRLAQDKGAAAFRFVDRVLVGRRQHGSQLTRLLRDAPSGRWERSASRTRREKECFLDMACFYHRHRGVIQASLAAAPKPRR